MVAQCPYCGNAGVHVQLYNRSGSWYCQCNKCKARGSFEHGSMQRAVEKWDSVAKLKVWE